MSILASSLPHHISASLLSHVSFAEHSSFCRFDAETLEIKTSRFVNHSARIASLAWHKDNIRLVSGSLDSGLFIFSLSTPSKVLSAKVRRRFISFDCRCGADSFFFSQQNAHNGGVCEVMWASDDEVASAGADGTWKTWKLPI